MTSGEMKFALVVESVLNSVPEPEYRQMLVEAICVVSMIVEKQVSKYKNTIKRKFFKDIR
jgi:phosphorylase kinase alpha/beta subunit